MLLTPPDDGSVLPAPLPGEDKPMSDRTIEDLLGPKPAKPSAIDQFVIDEEKSKKQQLIQTQQQQLDPARQAKALDISKEYGVPPHVAYESPQDFPDRKAALDFDAILRDTPATAKLMADPQKGPITKGDAKPLGEIETNIKTLGKNPLENSGVFGSTQKTVPSLRGFLFGDAGVLTPEQAKAEGILRTEEARQAAETEKLRAEAERNLRSGNPNIYDGANFAGTDIKMSTMGDRNAQDLTTKAQGPEPTLAKWRDASERFIQNVATGIVDAPLAGAIAIDSVRYLFGNVKTEADHNRIRTYLEETKAEIIDAMPGDKTRADETISALAGSAGYMATFLVGGMASKALKAPEWIGTALLGASSGGVQGVEDAKQYGASEGAQYLSFYINAALGATEAIPIDRALGRIERMSHGAVSQIIASGVANSIEEVIQEVGQQFGGNLTARMLYDPNRDLTDGLSQSATVAGLMGFVFGGSVKALGGLVERSRANKERLDKIAEAVNKSSTMNISPDLVAEHIRNIAQGDNAPAHISASHDAFITLFQGDGLSAEDVQKNFPEVAKALDEATQSGADVTIPTEQIAKLAKLKGFTEFSQDVRVGSEDMTAREAQAFSKDIQKQFDTLAKDESGVPDSTIRDTIRDQLVASGQSKEAATSQAALFASVIHTQAQRAGLDPYAMFARYGFTVSNPELEAIVQAPIETKGSAGHSPAKMAPKVKPKAPKATVQPPALDTYAAPQQESPPQTQPVGGVMPIQGSPAPLTLQQFKPNQLATDAVRFQYKGGGDAAGVTDRLKGVKQWDARAAGSILVWQDKDGKFWVVDGHQRHGLATRLAAEGQDVSMIGDVLREVDGVTADDARIIAADLNMKQGSGTALDAAKILKAQPSLLNNMPRNSALIRDAEGLSKLSDEAFAMVINEVVPQGYAAIVGRLAPNPATHVEILGILARTEPKNATEAESIVRDAMAAPQVEATMADLFGTSEVVQILYKERAQILDGAVAAIRKDRAAFNTLVKEQVRLIDAGNQLATDTNKERAQSDAEILATLQATARRKGPIADALAESAKQLSEGTSRQVAIRNFIDNIRQEAGHATKGRNASGNTVSLNQSSAAFQRWFGDSKVVDAAGKPLVVYHGTSSPDFHAFKERASNPRDPGFFGRGIYFTADQEIANEYAISNQENAPERVVPVYLSLQNPFVFDTRSDENFTKTINHLQQIGLDPKYKDDRYSWNLVNDEADRFTNLAKKAGFDGAHVIYDSGGDEFIAFSPTQIKSIHNGGNFDPNDARILNQPSIANEPAPAYTKPKGKDDGKPSDSLRGRDPRYSGGNLAPLAGSPVIKGAEGPDFTIQSVARKYAEENGLTFGRQASFALVDLDRARRIADAYEGMAHAPNDPVVKEAYQNLINQTIAQYRALETAGFKFYLYDETNNPYANNPNSAMRDLRANQTMGVFATEAGFGSSDTALNVDDNPLLADTGIEWPYGDLNGKKKRVLANDLFRAVHDLFGHGLEGVGFRADGEENAWQAHSRLFFGSAVGALTSETRGQNSWLNYGPHSEANKTAKTEDTIFADQKTGLMPSWTWTEGKVPDEPIQMPGKPIWWHGSMSGDLRGGKTGLHLGTKLAAMQALNAHIGIPAIGQWDGTREYGKTLLAGQKTLKKLDPRGYNVTGYNVDAPQEDYYPTKSIKYADGTTAPMTNKPSIQAFKLTGGMTNTSWSPHPDFKANGYMAASLKKGNAKNGFYYTNEGEDAGSVSIVVPNGNHVAPYVDTTLNQDLFDVEKGADGKLQAVIPGAGKASDAKMAQRGADAPLKPTKPQKQMDTGLFGEKDTQTTLFQSGTNNLSPAFAQWFGQSKVVDENGKPKMVFHGSSRGDRIGDKFKKSRATSGPMAYFTTDPQIASNYATGKPDTSLETPESYAGWFKFMPNGARTEVDIERAWHFLTTAQQNEIAAKLPHITNFTPDGDQMDSGFRLGGPDEYGLSSKGHWDYLIREARGNYLKAGVEAWLNGGSLFNQEEDFIQILEAAGMLMKQVKFDHPNATYSTVFPVYLSIQNPLVTSAISPETIVALDMAAQKSRTKPSNEGDTWDKRRRDAKEWIAELRDSVDNGKNSHVWTSIPDWVTTTLKSLGYDGIQDVGGKNGGMSHDVWIPFEEPQIKGVFNKGTFDQTDSRILYQSKEPFYSALGRAVEGMKQEKAPASQWMGMIKNTQGVKQEEVAWLGLEDWLNAQTGNITKKQIVDFIAANQVQVKEVVKGQMTDEQARLALDMSKEYWDDASQADHAGWREEAAQIEGHGGATKFHSYQMAGGDNYREMLLTLPAAKTREEISQNMFGRAQKTLNNDEFNKMEQAFKAQQQQGDAFKSSHFDEPNILAHVRFNDRTVDGKKVLHLEEIQSDWHQKGRKQGYKPSPEEIAALPRPRKWVEFMESKGFTKEEASVKWNQRFAREDVALHDEHLLETEQRIAAQSKAQAAVPDAPFKTTWHELAMKRMIRFAAENGYDRISWTQGDVQNDRYDLSKQVDFIGYRKNADGSYYLSVQQQGRGTVLNDGKITEAQLEETVGKDIAQKIVDGVGDKENWAGNNEPRNEFIVLRGLDLKIGGSGMKGFYDKMLVDTANKLGKKFGAKVGKTTINKGLVSSEYAREQSHYSVDAWNGLDARTRQRYINDVAGKDQLPSQEVHSLPITEAMRESVMQGQPLFQQNRGSIKFGPARDKFKVTLTGKSDLSTFLHESGHFFLEMMHDLADRGEASAQQKADLAAVRGWLGLEAGAQISTAAHEKFARGFEAYLMEGKAPSQDLVSTFTKFKSWLVFIYRSLSSLNVNLNDDIRNVMDRLVASDAAIAEARVQIGLTPKPMTQEETSLTDREYKAYVEEWIKAHDAQQQDVDAKMMIEAARATKAVWREEKAKIVETLTAEAEAMPGADAARQIAAMENKIQADTVPAEMRLNMKGLTSETGTPFDVAAEALGYESGEEMSKSIAAAKEAKRSINTKAAAAMVAKHGVMTPEKIAEAAARAVHNKPTETVMLTEFRALSAKAGIKAEKGVSDFLRRAAEAKLAQMTQREIDPVKWRRAELKAATQAGAYAAKGKALEASLAKRRQMMAAAMHRASTEALDRIEAINTYLSTFTTNKRRAQLGKAGEIYLDGVDQILENVEFKTVSLKTLNTRAKLQEIIAHATENEEPLNIPDYLMVKATNYSKMKMEQLEGVHDAVKNLWTLAKLKNTLRDRQEKRNMDEALAQMEINAEAALGTRKAQDMLNPSMITRSINRIRWARAKLVKMEFLFGWLDGKPDGGLMHRLVYQPIADARRAEFNMLKTMNAMLLDKLRAMPKQQKTRWETKRQFMGQSVKGANIIAAALNLGNESNKEKLLQGYGWSEAQLMAEINAFMTKEDWDMVQHIWDSIETLWPLIEGVAQRTTGLKPPKIERSALDTPHGTYSGGYYPVVYDPEADHGVFKRAQAASAGLFSNNFLRPTVGSGFTKERVKYKAPILLSLDVISNHLAEVVHYVTHYEALTQADKITRQPKFRTTVTNAMGKEFYREIRPWLQDIANNVSQRRSPDFAEPFFRNLRNGVSIGAMGYNIGTAFKQLLGVATALDAISPQYWASGIMKSWASPRAAANWKFALNESAELVPLIKDFDRDIKAVNDAYEKKFAGGAKDALIRHAFSVIGYFQLAVNVATWHGAYEQGLSRNLDHKAAVDHADSVVRKTQSSGAIKDLADVQRSSEATKTVTMFYSFFSVLYNRLEDITIQTKGVKDVPKAVYRASLLAILPTLLGMAGSAAYQALLGDDDKQDDAQPFLVTLATESLNYTFGSIPIFRSVFHFGAYKSQLSPVIGAWDKISNAATAASKIAQGKEPTRKQVRNMVDVVGIMTKTPGASLYKQVDDIWGKSVADSIGLR